MSGRGRQRDVYMPEARKRACLTLTLQGKAPLSKKCSRCHRTVMQVAEKGAID
jgi:uncharacterized metal-binding protein YceD (DUF177 family)